MYTITNVRKKSNLALAYNRLITNPESTYKNYFRNTYNDFSLALEENLKNISKNMKSGYLPQETIRVYMPKANGLSRMYTLLSIEDQIVYQAYANIIAEAICNKKVRARYKKSVFGNLYTNKEELFFYQQWQESYKAYTREIICAYKSGLEFIASFDLTACYDSINHSLIKDILVKNHISENCATEFIGLLNKWESSSGFELGTGIPQGPQASGIIAEMVLSEYDIYAEELQRKYKFKYFRYVDDIRILSDNEEVVRWVLFLLDKKSKELGLFPQSSKIVVHKIEDINREVKRISIPLFDEDFDDDEKDEIATKSISKLLKKKSQDLTLIKRYFHFVKHSSIVNKLSIKAVMMYPNLIHSFAYYVLRYPHKLPVSITNYIFDVCNDKTQQFAAGILLDAAIDKFNQNDVRRFVSLAKKLLDDEKKYKFIFDCRFRVQLLLLVILHGGNSDRKIKGMLACKRNWWEEKELFYKLTVIHGWHKDKYVEKQLYNSNSDIALSAISLVIREPSRYDLLSVAKMSPLIQNTLMAAGIIRNKKYSHSQINKYVAKIIDKDIKIAWKKKLGKEHNPLERNMFWAVGYWKTDLTAFVNIWDCIDDRLCDEVTKCHPELGGYTLGKIGCLSTSVKMKSILPKFYYMAMEIHNLRLQSHLSHSVVKATSKYTGPIKHKERTRIKKIIADGLEELASYW